MKFSAQAALAGLGLALVGALAPSSVEARKQDQFRYPFQHVWNAALRMVRVDMHMPVTDRDKEAGYLLFEYVEGERRYTGSIELIAREEDNRPLVTAVVSVGGMPSYVEQMMLDRLGKKLVAEYGEPLDPPAEEPPSKEPAKPPADDELPLEPPAGEDPGDMPSA